MTEILEYNADCLGHVSLYCNMENALSTAIARAGQFVKQPTGYRAFVPARLPPDPPISLDEQLQILLSEADQSVGRLDGVVHILPDADVFVAMSVRQEAVLSSQIEGTQSSLDDVLAFELDPGGKEIPQDVTEVVNYIRALNFGLKRLDSLPLSLRLIREIHAILLDGVRGSSKQPGEFRVSQNWIGAGTVLLDQAIFVPPPPEEMKQALSEFEEFLHAEDDLPILIRCGLAHAQFETIHPFLDGNGRIGRLLITFLLCYEKILHQPVLYLSTYLKRNRTEYYDRLMAIRERGDWEGWLRFFLRGIAETATEATQTALAVISLREAHRRVIQESGLGANGFAVLDLLFHVPLVNVLFVKDRLNLSFSTANKILTAFMELNLLEETTGQKRNRRFRYWPYLALFEIATTVSLHDEPLQFTAGLPAGSPDAQELPLVDGERRVISENSRSPESRRPARRSRGADRTSRLPPLLPRSRNDGS